MNIIFQLFLAPLKYLKPNVSLTLFVDLENLSESNEDEETLNNGNIIFQPTNSIHIRLNEFGH